MIAEMSLNFLERQVLRRSHQLTRMPSPEYGLDAWMLHFSRGGYPENGHVYFQLKATDKLRTVDGGRSITVRVECAHLMDWWQVKHHPVILVVYDAQKNRAFWLDVQAYCDRLNETDPHKLQLDSETITLRIPISNKLSVYAVDKFRQLSLSRMS